MLLKPKQIICPDCGYDGSRAPKHGADEEPFRHVEEILVWRPVVGMIGNMAEDGTLGVDVSEMYQSGEGYDDGKNGRLECRECLGFFEIPAGLDIEWVSDPLQWLGRPCSDGCQGWRHSDEPHEIERCDDCNRFAGDEEAVLAHRRECGCDWPEVDGRKP